MFIGAPSVRQTRRSAKPASVPHDPPCAAPAMAGRQVGCRDQLMFYEKAWREMEAAPGFEPGNNGFADRRLTTWLCRRRKDARWNERRLARYTRGLEEKNGAGNGVRTRDPN